MIKHALQLFVAITLMSALDVQAAEIIIGKCGPAQAVIAKVKSIETNGGNELMHMVAKNGTQAILIHTYNPKIEKFKGVIDVDKDFYYYDSVECTYKYEGQRKSYSGYFFVNKREVKGGNNSVQQANKSGILEFSGTVDLPGTMGGSITNEKNITLLYETGTEVANKIEKACGINNKCIIQCVVDSHGYIRKIMKIQRAK